MATALLAGSFGQGSPGDEALLEAFARALPDWRLSVVTSDPTSTRSIDGCQAVAARDAVAVGRAAVRAEAIVLSAPTIFGGGSRFDRRFPSAPLARSLALLEAARVRQRPRAIVGAAVDPLRTPLARRLANRLVRSTDLLVLRDSESAEALAAAGASPPFRIGADPAWTVVAPLSGDGAGDQRVERDHNRVIVALGPPAGGAVVLEALADTLAPLGRAGHDVVIQPWCASDEDAGLAGSLAMRMAAAPRIAEPPATMREARDAFARAGLVIGLRYHALIAAAAANVPFLALEDRPELVRLARRLGQPVAPAGAQPAELSAVILEALDGPPPSRAAVAGQVAAAEEGFRLLRLLTSGGRSDDADDLIGLRLEPEPRG